MIIKSEGLNDISVKWQELRQSSAWVRIVFAFFNRSPTFNIHFSSINDSSRTNIYYFFFILNLHRKKIGFVHIVHMPYLSHITHFVDKPILAGSMSFTVSNLISVLDFFKLENPRIVTNKLQYVIFYLKTNIFQVIKFQLSLPTLLGLLF